MLCLSLEHPVMSHLSSFPILVFVLVAYLGIAALGGMMLDGDALTISLASGAEMTLRGGDLFVAGGLVALTIDLAKMSRGGRLGHVVRAVAFVAALACLMLLSAAGTVTFLLLGLMTLVEMIAGVAITRHTR